MVRILAVRKRFPETEALLMHLRMTHRQYVGDLKVLPKTKTEKRRTIKDQAVEMHEMLHADMDDAEVLPHGLQPHVHLDI